MSRAPHETAQSMRRHEKEVTDRAALEEILHSAPLLSLALRDDPAPYVIPVCFGLDGENLYVHSALAGTKIDLIMADPIVGFCACADVSVTAAEPACASSASGRSVVGTGRARIVRDEAERERGLNAIMRHYQGAGPVAGTAAAAPTYRPEQLSRTAVIAIRIDTLHGKRV